TFPYHSPQKQFTSPEKRTLLYVIDPASFHSGNDTLPIEIYVQEPRKNGMMGKPRPANLSAEEWLAAPDPNDRLIAHMLLGAPHQYSYYYNDDRSSRRFDVPAWAFDSTLKSICQTNRCFLRQTSPDVQYKMLEWDDGAAWQMQLELAPIDSGAYHLQG